MLRCKMCWRQRIVEELNGLFEDEYILVPGDKACSSIVFAYKANHYNCIVQEVYFTI